LPEVRDYLLLIILTLENLIWSIIMRHLIVRGIIQSVAFFRSVAVKKVAILAIAGLLLFTSTACNPSSPRVVGEGSYDKRVGQPTELYDPVQPAVGGMNGYNDDPKLDRGESKGKARSLVNNAKQNLERASRNPEDAVENYQDNLRLGKRTRNLTEDVKGRAERLKDDVSEGTKRGINNLQENTKDAGRSVKQTVEDATQTAEQKSRDLAKSVKRAGDDTSTAVDNKVRDTGKAIRRTGEEVVDQTSDRLSNINNRS
jgi:hypothetical protein